MGEISSGFLLRYNSHRYHIEFLAKTRPEFEGLKAKRGILLICAGLAIYPEANKENVLRVDR